MRDDYTRHASSQTEQNRTTRGRSDRQMARQRGDCATKLMLKKGRAQKQKTTVKSASAGLRRWEYRMRCVVQRTAFVQRTNVRPALIKQLWFNVSQIISLFIISQIKRPALSDNYLGGAPAACGVRQRASNTWAQQEGGAPLAEETGHELHLLVWLDVCGDVDDLRHLLDIHVESFLNVV